jgi:RND family efflux transporter MFP subunit
MNRGKQALLAGVLAMLLTGCRGGEAETDAAAAAQRVMVLQPGDVALVEARPLNAGVMLTGTLNPYQVVEVRAQVPGLVSRLAVDRGVAVRTGQLIAVIQAEGIRSAAAGAQAQVASAQAALSVARQRLESSRKLFESGAISEIDMKTAQAGYEAAEGQLAAARAQASAAGESARRATVTSPIGGEVSLRHVSQGEAVNPGQPLVTVVNSAQLELAGQIPVLEAAHVRPGQRVEFTLDAYPGRTFEGTVARVEPTADPATRQVGVYLRLPNEGRRIVGGLFASGRVLTGAVDTVVSIPEAAVRTEANASFVYVVAQERLARRSVVLGAHDAISGRVQVISGVNAGERVLVAPGAVAADTPIRFATPAAPAAAPAGQTTPAAPAAATE